MTTLPMVRLVSTSPWADFIVLAVRPSSCFVAIGRTLPSTTRSAPISAHHARDGAREAVAITNTFVLAFRSCVASEPDERFARIDPDRVHLDQDVVLTERRLCGFAQRDREAVEGVRLLVDERSHSVNLSVKVSLTPASGPPSC